MSWTLLILINLSTFTADVRLHSIPMMTKEACMRAAKEFTDNSSRQLGYICISSETGESIRFSK